MTKSFFIISLLVCLSLSTFTANTQNINTIKEKYYEVKQSIALQSKEVNCQNNGKISFTHNVPGIGPQTFHCTFFFTPYQYDDEGFIKPHNLQFVQCTFNIAARDYYEEYLYDENGNLIFAYGKGPSLEDCNKSHEIRLYLNNMNLIKVISDYTRENQDNDFYKQELLTRATYFIEAFSSINDFCKNE